MGYTLGSWRTFRSDLALCNLHEFLRLSVTDMREGIPERVSGTVSTSAFLLDITVMSSSGVIVSPSDVPVGQLQPWTTVISYTDAGSMATPFVVPPPPDIEQLCRQLQDFRTCRKFIDRFFHVHGAAEATRVFVVFAFDCHFQLFRRESLRPTGDAVLPPPADDCLFPEGSDYPSSLPERAMVRLTHQPDPAVFPTGSVVMIFMTVPVGLLTPASVRTSAWYSQVTGDRRYTEFRWKPGIRITASSYYSALRQRRMSGVVPPPIAGFRPRGDMGYCSSPLQLDDCTVEM